MQQSSQLDEEQEKQIKELLNTRVKLDNGDEGYVFTLDTSSDPRGRYFCHLCSSMLCSKSALLQHSEGKNHSKKSLEPYHSNEKFTRVVMRDNIFPGTDNGILVTAPGVDMVNLAPGEPVPPGFEDVVRRVPEISKKLELVQAALIGLEFLVEVTTADGESEPRYICLLCDKKGDSRTVFLHLISLNHRLRYLARYFPRVNEAIHAIPRTNQYREGTGEAIAKVVRAIENKFGRLTPIIVEYKNFNEEKKAEILREMLAGRHFHETQDSQYESLVDLSMIKKFGEVSELQRVRDLERDEMKELTKQGKVTSRKAEDDLRDADDLPVSILEENVMVVDKSAFDEDANRNTQDMRVSRSISKSPDKRPERRRSPRRSRSTSRERIYRRTRGRLDDHRRMPFRRTLSRSRSRSRSRSPFRRRRDIGLHRRTYRRNSPYRRSPSRRRTPPRRLSPPRRHSPPRRYSPRPSSRSLSFKVKPTPSMKDREWEAKREQKNKQKAQVENYKKLVDEEAAQKLKTYEKTPENHPAYSEEWKMFWNRRYKELIAEGQDASKHNFKPEWIKFWTVRIKELMDDEKAEKIKLYCDSIGAPELAKGNGTSSDLSEDDDIIEITPIPPIRNSNKDKHVKIEVEETIDLGEDEDDGCDIIAVLRLLAALEVQLGTLGPQINRLLSRAVAFDKIEKGGAQALLDIKDHVVLFETAKEKLKGQLFAGIVEKNMLKGTKKAIAAVATMFNSYEAEQLKNKERTVAAVPPPVIENSTSNLDATVDKLALAQQVAAVLVSQGRTDVTQAELEQVIDALIGGNTEDPKPVEKPSEAPAPTNLQMLLTSVVQTQTAKNTTSKNSEESPQTPSRTRDMKDLSENDLKGLLQNFKDLSPEEQQGLVIYLKELEAKDPQGVEKLRKYIDYGVPPSNEEHSPESQGRLSPFSLREGGANPTNLSSKKLFDDDEDDYSFDDICKAVKKNIKAAKSKTGKQVAEQMIKDQEKKAAEVTKQTVRKGVSIDPNDLLNAATDSPETSSLHNQIPVSVASENHSTTHTSINPLPPAFNPQAPPPMLSWDSYQHQTYNYDGSNAYPYNQEAETNYQNYPPPNWSVSGQYQQPDQYATENQFSYAPPEYDPQQNPYNNPPYGYY